jgi:hypothetical protein
MNSIKIIGKFVFHSELCIYRGKNFFFKIKLLIFSTFHNAALCACAECVHSPLRMTVRVWKHVGVAYLLYVQTYHYETRSVGLVRQKQI